MSFPATTHETHLAPGGLPGLGHALQMRRDPLALFESLRPYGDVVRIKLGPQQVYVVTSTAVSTELFVSKYRSFDKGVAVEHFRSVFGSGLLSSDGEMHRADRLLMQPAFHRERLADYVELMREQVVEHTATWRDGDVLDARAALTAITLGVVTRAMISAKVGDDLAAEIQLRLPRILDLSYRRAMNPLPFLNRLPLPHNREFADLVARLHPRIDAVIADYHRSDTTKPDLLSMMLTARDESSGASMADDRIHDQVMTILLAGSETAATALSWIFLLLDGHPEVATRLLAELDEVLGERPVRAADLPRLTYTTQVVDESLRHSPPIWLITRRATEDVSLGGHLVPRGASVLLSPYLTGHDPTLIEDPDTFDPDRWAADRVTQPLRLAALPFGAGPRKCIGDSFAVVEAIVAIATILPRWRVRRQPGNTITKTAGLTYFPAGLRLTVEARDREPATPNSGSAG
ncbi:cytochrome P450 [Nocardia terpenica]|uniref:Cytochrome P450 n=1 Tax=Nocardia terpenica TaxID=455432 RepID=A0A6G9ZAA3_9NOCA|nr:cytochrome P450 [Nocardia terpenica]QIS21943.1 cytochrome P450 [Nocardia terpenica]